MLHCKEIRGDVCSLQPKDSDLQPLHAMVPAVKRPCWIQAKVQRLDLRKAIRHSSELKLQVGSWKILKIPGFWWFWYLLMQVLLFLGAANMDPTVFTNPKEFRLVVSVWGFADVQLLLTCRQAGQRRDAFADLWKWVPLASLKVISGTWWTKWWRKCTMQNSSSLWSLAKRNREEAHGETVLTFRPLQFREFRFVLSRAQYRDFNPLHLQVPGSTTAWGVAIASLFSNNEQPNNWKKTYIDPVQHAEVWWS